MTSLCYVEPELGIALNKKIIFVNPNDLQIFKEVELPDDLTKYGLKIVEEHKPEIEAATEKPSKKSKPPQTQETPSITHALLSPSRLQLAVTTAVGQKAVLIYQCRPEHAKLVSVRPLARASSALHFSPDSKTLLVVDKSGDCYAYDCVDLEAPARLLFGHLSIVYDVVWTRDGKHIISCDRDDKIRVTNYPDTYDIHGYCLGHKEFVAGLALLRGEVLASVSGDKTLRLWNYQSGEQLTSFDLPAPGIRLALRALTPDKYQAAVLLHQPDECVGFFELEFIENKWQISEKRLLAFGEMIVSNMCFVDEHLYVAGTDENERLRLKVAALKGESETVSLPEGWLDMVESQFKDETWKPEDISAWFKKRYDNVSDYLERKKRRMEEKQK